MTKLFALIFLILSNSAFAVTLNCAALWRNGFPYPGQQRAEFRCTEFTTSNSHTRLFYPTAEEMDPTTQSLAINVVRALDHSWSELNSLGRMPNVNVVIYNRNSPHDSGSGSTTYAEAHVRWHYDSEACPVVIYPAAKTFSAEWIKQLIAHELFHCFQKLHNPAQTELGANPATNEGPWWLEGIAQYFSNWVYPSIDLEYTDNFIPYDPSTPLVSQSTGHGNVHFFQSLANQKGPRFLLSFMSHMPSTPGSDQAAALASVPEIDDLFHKFAQDMSSGKLRDENRAIAPTPRVSRMASRALTTESSTQERQFVFIPGAISTYTLTFPEKGSYRLQWVLPEGAKGSYRVVGDIWKELPETINTDCREAKDFEFLFTTTTPGAFETAFLYVERTELEEECPCQVTSRPTHACLWGNWELENSTAEDLVRRLMQVPNLEFVGIEGTFHVRFSRDGSMQWTLNNWSVKHRLKKEDRRRGTTYVNMTNILNGTATSRYSDYRRSNICAASGETNVTSEMVMETNGTVIRQPQPAPPILPTNGMEFTYECQGNTFIYKQSLNTSGPMGNMTFNYRFRKID